MLAVPGDVWVLSREGLGCWSPTPSLAGADPLGLA